MISSDVSAQPPLAGAPERPSLTRHVRTCAGRCVGSLHVRMRAGADEQAVLTRVRRVFRGVVHELTVHVVVF